MKTGSGEPAWTHLAHSLHVLGEEAPDGLSPAALPTALAAWECIMPLCRLQVYLFFLFLDTSLGYLSLLDADYDRSPPNKYFAPAVNYTVRFQWVQCLFWEAREWKSASFSAQPGASPEKVTCRYRRAVEDTLETSRGWLHFLPRGGPCANGDRTWCVCPSPSAAWPSLGCSL